MEALRRLASFSNDVALSETAQHCAAGALFELDEVTRHKAKEAAVAVKTLEARSDKLLST